MRKSAKKNELMIKSEIKQLEQKRNSLDRKIKDLTEYLGSVGSTRRIKPCETDDSKDNSCPWNEAST